MYIFKLALKNVAARKSSLVIILFIAFSIALLVLSNAVFDGTDNGIQNTFVNSFTGDIVIRPQAQYPLSLFGDETPVTGELSTIPSLIPYSEVLDCVRNADGIASTVSQLSGAAAFNINNTRITTALFGVNGDEYASMMGGIEILEGEPYTATQKGIMLNTASVESIKSSTGVELHPGDSVQLITSDGSTFSIRSAPVSAIYRYKVPNSTLDRIALINPVILRDLMGMQDVSDDIELSEDQIDLIEFDSSLDDLFSDVSDVAGVEVDSDSLTDVFFNNMDAKTTEVDEMAGAASSTVWSFIVCKVKDGVPVTAVMASLNAEFKRNGWPVQAVNWRTAAGGTVSLIYYLRTILNIGIILILATGFIVVNNTLTISALGRVCETGTLRALGANRLFVAMQFFFETAILTVTAGVLGCILGAVANNILLSSGIRIENMYLSQLFGGSTLTTVVTFRNLFSCMLLSLLLAVIGWLYPVHVALKSAPIEAMRGAV